VYDVGIVITYRRRFPTYLARRWGIATWTGAALYYVMEGMSSRRIIESTMRTVRELSWGEFIGGRDEYELLQLREGLPEVDVREVIAYAWGNVGKAHSGQWLRTVARRLIRRHWLALPLSYPGHVSSSLVDDAYLYAGVDLIPGQGDTLVSPDDLADSPLLKPVEVNLGARIRRIHR
jgi:hypothetical protein